MAWPNGKARERKTGGRKKGTPNRKTMLLRDTFENLGFDVPGRLYSLLSELSPREQAEILLKLMEYLYPKRKAIELPHDNRQPSEISHANLMTYITEGKTHV